MRNFLFPNPVHSDALSSYLKVGLRARAWKRNIIPRVIGDFLFIVSSLLRALPVYHEGNEKSCGG